MDFFRKCRQDNANARGRAKNAMGFVIVNKHFKEQLQQMPDDQQVAVVVIKRATGLPFATNSFCRVKIMEQIRDFDQLQRTGKICGTDNPVWGETERFNLIVNPDSKILFSVLRNYGMKKMFAEALGKKKFLGDAILKVSELATEIKEYVLPLHDPDNGSSEGKLFVDAKLVSKAEALNSGYQVCYEYERYMPHTEIRWSTANLTSTDPGRFSNHDNTTFADEFEAVTEPLPENWTVVSQWMTDANPHGDGWLYAVDFWCPNWYPTKVTGACVRRKTWSRFIAHEEIAANIAAENDKKAEEGVNSSDSEKSTNNNE